MNLKTYVSISKTLHPYDLKSQIYVVVCSYERDGEGAQSVKKNVHRLPKLRPENSCHIKRNGKIIILVIILTYPQLIYKFKIYSQKKYVMYISRILFPRGFLTKML
jgi:hypothetical protein